MISLLRSILTGALVSLIFGFLIILVLSALIYEHPIKTPKDLKDSTLSLISSLNKLKSLNSRSENLINSEIALDEFSTNKNPNAEAALKNKEQNNFSLSYSEFNQLKKDIQRLQKQLDRIENNSRSHHLQIKFLERQNEIIKNSIRSFSSDKESSTIKTK
jgi:hypothetical protein